MYFVADPITASESTPMEPSSLSLESGPTITASRSRTASRVVFRNIVSDRQLRTYVCTDEELDSSHVNWPLTATGTKWAFVLCCLFFGGLVVGFEICDNDDKCSRDAWPSKIWGARYQLNYCEVDRQLRFMAEHQNSLSNLWFCAAGTVTMICGLADYLRPILRSDKALQRRNHVLDFPIFSLLCGLNWWLLGVFSFAFHAHPSAITIFLDVGGIYVALSPVVVYVALFFVDVNLEATMLYYIRMSLVVAEIIMSVLLLYYKWELSAIEVSW